MAVNDNKKETKSKTRKSSTSTKKKTASTGRNKSTSTASKRKTSGSTKKTSSSSKRKKKDVLDPMDVAPMALHGEVFWEYRAKNAEWENTHINLAVALQNLEEEKSDPKYQKLLEMMRQEQELREELKRRAQSLRKTQERVANHLGISLRDFLSKCVIDHETGVVRYID